MSYEIDFSFLVNLFPVIPPNVREIISAIMVFFILLTFFPALIAYLVFKIVGLSGFRRLFSYERRKSLAHQMHPLPKIMFVLFISIGVAMVEELWMVIILAIISISMWSISNPSEDKMRLLLILLLTQWLLVAWGQSFLNPYYTRGDAFLTAIYQFPKPLRDIFNLNYITLDGFRYGLFQGLRLVAALSAAIWLITTTHPSEIIYGLRIFRFPVEINFMIAIAFRSIPTILEKSSLVLAAEIARGLRVFPKPSMNVATMLKEIFRAFYVVVMAFIPVIVESLRSGRQLALAATTKAFRAYKDRTYFRKIPMTTFDKVYTAVFTIGLTLIIVLPFLSYYLNLPITI